MTGSLHARPVLNFAGTYNVWQDGVVIDGPFVNTPPPGLTGLTGPCTLHLLGGSTATFDIVGTDVWLFVP